MHKIGGHTLRCKNISLMSRLIGHRQVKKPGGETGCVSFCNTFTTKQVIFIADADVGGIMFTNNQIKLEIYPNMNI